MFISFIEEVFSIFFKVYILTLYSISNNINSANSNRFQIFLKNFFLALSDCAMMRYEYCAILISLSSINYVSFDRVKWRMCFEVLKHETCR